MTEKALINTALFSAIEKIVNEALKLDSATQQRLNTLIAQKGAPIRVGIQLHKGSSEKRFHILVIADENYLTLQSTEEVDPDNDIDIEGKPKEFIELFTQETKSSVFSSSDARVQGNIQLMREIQSIASDLDIDWEAKLVDKLGVLAGHELATFIRNNIKSAQEKGPRIQKTLHNYIIEELKWIPSSEEAERQFQSIEDMRARTDRLEARIKEHTRKTGLD